MGHESYPLRPSGISPKVGEKWLPSTNTLRVRCGVTNERTEGRPICLLVEVRGWVVFIGMYFFLILLLDIFYAVKVFEMFILRPKNGIVCAGGCKDQTIRHRQFQVGG